jgi:hypothetical protein
MDSAEMAQYVRARLDRAGADPGQRAQIEAALDQLYARSHGNPGRLHAAAAALLCFGPGRLCAPVEREEPIEEEEPAPPAEARGEIPAAAEIAVDASVSTVEVAVESSTFERVSIESLVAEAVASEPLEKIAVPAPTTALVVPAVSAPDSPASASPPDGQPPRAPRKRHRLRRLGRR